MTSKVTAPANHKTYQPPASWVIAGALTVAAVLGFAGNLASVGPVQDTLH